MRLKKNVRIALVIILAFAGCFAIYHFGFSKNGDTTDNTASNASSSKKTDTGTTSKKSSAGKKKASGSTSKKAYEVTDTAIALDFQETPVQYYDRGYLVKVNGYYGFIDVDGNVIIDLKYTGYDKRDVLYRALINKSDTSVVPDVCMSLSGSYDMNNTDSNYLEYLLNLNSVDTHCHTSGFGGTDSRVLSWDTVSGQAMFTPNSYETVAVPFTSYPKDKLDAFYQGNYSVYFANENNYTDIAISDDYARPAQVLHILNADGAAVSNETISKVLSYDTYNQTGISMLTLGVNTSSAVQRTADGKWALLSANGSFLTGFDYDDIKVLNQNTFKFTKGSVIGIIDYNGNILLQGDFEDVTQPIGDKALIKENNKWEQIKINR